MSSQAKFATVVLGLAAVTLGQEALATSSVYLLPAVQNAAAPFTGPFTLDLWMDFTGDPTLGGGVDFALSTLPGTMSFSPSSYFTGIADPAFSGFGKQYAYHDFEVHFGSFGGLSGKNLLGTFTVNLDQPIPAKHSELVTLSIDDKLGSGGYFYSSATGQQQQVTFGDGRIFNPVPEPQVYALMLAGLVGLCTRRKLHRRAR